MKLQEFLSYINDPKYDVVSVYDSTPSDFYHTLYEGGAEDCPESLLDRDVIGFYPAFVAEDAGICIGLDGYDGFEKE